MQLVKPTALIFTGSRNETPELWAAARKTILEAKSLYSKLAVLHGNCRTGLDCFVEEICEDVGIFTLPLEAEWSLFGLAAGPNRNGNLALIGKALQDCGWEVIVHAFPRGTSKGTNDCIDKCYKLGIETIHIHFIDGTTKEYT